MTLEDVDPAMFGAVVNWLYTQKIEEMQQDEDGHVVAIREGRLVLLGKLWMLGQVCFLVWMCGLLASSC